MKVIYQLGYKKPGRKIASPVSLNGTFCEHAFCEAEMTIEYNKKQYRAFRLLVLAEEEIENED
jgi:hypothetical protein